MYIYIYIYISSTIKPSHKRQIQLAYTLIHRLHGFKQFQNNSAHSRTYICAKHTHKQAAWLYATSKQWWVACSILGLANLVGFFDRAYLGSGAVPGVNYIHANFWHYAPGNIFKKQTVDTVSGEIDPLKHPMCAGFYCVSLSVIKG
jgi:hypothetical protein